VRGAAAVVLALVAYVALFVVGLDSTYAAVVALVAAVAALVLGIVVARRAEPRSADALLGVAGAVLAGMLFLLAALVVVLGLLGLVEFR
jgi:hypothetical protein